MRTIVTTFVLAVAGAGCLSINPVDGALLCSSTGSQCPNGYYCAHDNTCWHMGKAPGMTSTGGGNDMSVAGNGGGGDMAGSGGKGGGDMSDTTPIMMSCVMPSDCPAPSKPCLLQACIGGTCALVTAPNGTPLADSMQVPHDCKKLFCDSDGNPTPMADTTDLPVDTSGGCATPSCNGATPNLAPTASGTACTAHANGICNGNGVCGDCKPGSTACVGNTTSRQQCTPAGKWAPLNPACPNACTNGLCTGNCNAANPPICGDATHLQTCVSNSWSTTDCTQGGTTVCSTESGMAKCQGTCSPIAPSCAGNGHLVGCDANGHPTDVDCTAKVAGGWCVNNQCTACQPTASQCTGGSTYEVCDANGNWTQLDCATAHPSSSNSCSNSGSGIAQAQCSCTDPNDPCGGFTCGNVTNACGKVQSCGICDSGTRCLAHQCVATTTSTTDTTCPCGGTKGKCQICQ